MHALYRCIILQQRCDRRASSVTLNLKFLVSYGYGLCMYCMNWYCVDRQSMIYTLTFGLAPCPKSSHNSCGSDAFHAASTSAVFPLGGRVVPAFGSTPSRKPHSGGLHVTHPRCEMQRRLACIEITDARVGAVFKSPPDIVRPLVAERCFMKCRFAIELLAWTSAPYSSRDFTAASCPNIAAPSSVNCPSPGVAPWLSMRSGVSTSTFYNTYGHKHLWVRIHTMLQQQFAVPSVARAGNLMQWASGCQNLCVWLVTMTNKARTYSGSHPLASLCKGMTVNRPRTIVENPWFLETLAWCRVWCSRRSEHKT